MRLFLEILVANIALVIVLITVHECGHWFFGRVVGIPRHHMRIRLLTFPQQVQIRDGNSWLSVSAFDRYFECLRVFVPTTKGQFWYVVGGFVFETGFLIALTAALSVWGHKLYAIVAPGVSLTMYLIYILAMDIPQSRNLKRPWGDTTILLSLARGPAILVIGAMILVRAALILGAWLRF